MKGSAMAEHYVKLFLYRIYDSGRSVDGVNAFLHAIRVADLLHDEEQWIVGALHDVVEDGKATFEELQTRFQLSEIQMNALKILTRNEGESYSCYISRVKRNALAVQVKLCDLKDNIQRCANDLPGRLSLLKRYLRAYDELYKKDFSRRLIQTTGGTNETGK